MAWKAWLPTPWPDASSTMTWCRGCRAGTTTAPCAPAVERLMAIVSGDEARPAAPEAGPKAAGQMTRMQKIIIGIVILLFLLLLITNPSLAIYLLFSILSGGRGGGGSGGGFSGGGGRSGGGGASGSW